MESEIMEITDDIDNMKINEKKVKTKEYNKIYHSSNENFINNYKNARKECECGKVVSRLNYYHHIKNKSHIDTMKKIKEIIERYENV